MGPPPLPVMGPPRCVGIGSGSGRLFDRHVVLLGVEVMDVAFREVAVMEIREVLRGWLDGGGVRTITDEAGWTARSPAVRAGRGPGPITLAAVTGPRERTACAVVDALLQHLTAGR